MICIHEEDHSFQATALCESKRSKLSRESIVACTLWLACVLSAYCKKRHAHAAYIFVRLQVLSPSATCSLATFAPLLVKEPHCGTPARRPRKGRSSSAPNVEVRIGMDAGLWRVGGKPGPRSVSPEGCAAACRLRIPDSGPESENSEVYMPCTTAASPVANTNAGRRQHTQHIPNTRAPTSAFTPPLA